jgi:hypothetical protein
VVLKNISIGSGYRSHELNHAVGGASTSQHLLGMAADITAGSKDGNRTLFELAQKLKLPYDQLIDERDYAWIHVSHRSTGSNRTQTLHIL